MARVVDTRAPRAETEWTICWSQSRGYFRWWEHRLKARTELT